MLHLHLTVQAVMAWLCTQSPQYAIQSASWPLAVQVSDEEKEKRRWGRLQKAKGDMCLMAGSPRDGYDHYKSAMELAKVCAACCGVCAALLRCGVAHGVRQCVDRCVVPACCVAAR